MSATARVKRALYQGPVGYTYQSEKLFYFEGKVTRAEILEHVLPDVGAGAQTRRRTKCLRHALHGERYANHGGISTGPKTKAGRARIAALQRERHAHAAGGSAR